MDRKILLDFLRSEINGQSFYDDIMKFIFSYHIRNGEFECNEYIIKKIDQNNYFIFKEYIFLNETRREINNATSVFRNNLVYEINKYSENIGIDISKYERFEEKYLLETYYN